MESPRQSPEKSKAVSLNVSGNNSSEPYHTLEEGGNFSTKTVNQLEVPGKQTKSKEEEEDDQLTREIDELFKRKIMEKVEKQWEEKEKQR